MDTVDSRLERFVSSGICKAHSAKTHAVKLKRFAREFGDEADLGFKMRFFKALGDSTRLRIIKMLAGDEMCVCEIMVALDLTQPNASHHLSILEREGIVKKRREGKWILYRLSNPTVMAWVDLAPL